MSRLLARFVDDECGATAIEYALIAGGISIVIITAVNGVGTCTQREIRRRRHVDQVAGFRPHATRAAAMVTAGA